METFVLINVTEFSFSIWLLEMWGGGKTEKDSVCLLANLVKKRKTGKRLFPSKFLPKASVQLCRVCAPALRGPGEPCLARTFLQHFCDFAKERGAKEGK